MKDSNLGCAIPIGAGIICAIIAGGNGDNINALVGFIVGAGVSALIVWRIKDGPKY